MVNRSHLTERDVGHAQCEGLAALGPGFCQVHLSSRDRAEARPGLAAPSHLGRDLSLSSWAGASPEGRWVF